MSGFVRRHQLRVVLPLLATVGVAYWLWASPSAPSAESPLEEDEEDNPKLSIAWLEPVEVRPGQAVMLHVVGLDPDGPQPWARLSIGEEKYGARILRRDGERVVVQVPRSVPTSVLELPPSLPSAVGKLRIYQGERKTKPRFLQLRPLAVRDMTRDALGGLAVLIVGLTLVGRALRNYAGQRVRARMTTLTRSRPRSVVFGGMLGGLTQSTTSSAGILANMLEARLLPEASAVALLLGAQVGAASAGALLPLFATREALWVVVLGALWTVAADDRRARALGHIVLGCGMLFLGLSLLQAGVRPLLSEPALLPYVHRIAEDHGVAVLASAGLGALLAASLQGPGPAYALVLSLTQTSGLLSLTDGLTILSGTALGATVGIALVAWPAGPLGRRLAVAQVMLGLVVSALCLAGVPLWAAAADVLAAGDPNALHYGSRVLRPAMGSHLGAAFVISQLAAALLCMPLLPFVARLAARLTPTSQSESDGGDSDLLSVLSPVRTAITALGDVLETRDRAPAVEAERAIGRARLAVASLLRAIERDPTTCTADVATATACLHLATATDGALRVAERALERDLSTDAAGARHLMRVHVLLVEGIEGLIAHAAGRRPLELDEVQAREITLNALEAEARALTRSGTALSERLWQSELASACETIGNHIYRLANALARGG